jgi:hypothetical protein
MAAMHTSAPWLDSIQRARNEPRCPRQSKPPEALRTRHAQTASSSWPATTNRPALPGWPGSSSGSDGAVAHLCCAICCLRLPRNASPWACPTRERPLVRTNARAALGYRLFEITDSASVEPSESDGRAAGATAVRVARVPRPARVGFADASTGDGSNQRPRSSVWSAGDAAGHTAPNELPLPRRGRRSRDGRPIATLKVRLSRSSAK